MDFTACLSTGCLWTLEPNVFLRFSPPVVVVLAREPVAISIPLTDPMPTVMRGVTSTSRSSPAQRAVIHAQKQDVVVINKRFHIDPNIEREFRLQWTVSRSTLLGFGERFPRCFPCSSYSPNEFGIDTCDGLVLHLLLLDTSVDVCRPQNDTFLRQSKTKRSIPRNNNKKPHDHQQQQYVSLQCIAEKCSRQCRVSTGTCSERYGFSELGIAAGQDRGRELIAPAKGQASFAKSDKVTEKDSRRCHHAIKQVTRPLTFGSSTPPAAV
ncbi:unnamed protein product [Notodromas monacha]|uniref:Uncharacterized protein n=1 Tax=Notodromas monacha TaxID=399045 RepID=A0A7R9GEJ5_9CRUS|nr:unnamed protein product [Notodromas monacha]CAG0918126.1 unnamed protein product [Notodromas monacha]